MVASRAEISSLIIYAILCSISLHKKLHVYLYLDANYTTSAINRNNFMPVITLLECAQCLYLQFKIGGVDCWVRSSTNTVYHFYYENKHLQSDTFLL